MKEIIGKSVKAVRNSVAGVFDGGSNALGLVGALVRGTKKLNISVSVADQKIEDPEVAVETVTA